MSVFNDNARIGMAYKVKGGGQRFINNSGATISQGQVAAIDIGETRSAYIAKTVISTGSANQQYPICIADADVASAAEGLFFTEGKIPCQVATSVTAVGTIVCPGTANATGGNQLIASGTTNRNSCGWILNGTGQGTTLVDAIIIGQNPGTNR